MTEREYRYPERGGRRGRLPRGFVFCKQCRAKVSSRYVDGLGFCASCVAQLPLFELDPKSEQR